MGKYFEPIYKIMTEFVSSVPAWLGLILAVSSIMIMKIAINQFSVLYKWQVSLQTKKIKIKAKESAPAHSFVTAKNMDSVTMGPTIRQKLTYDSTCFSKDNTEHKQALLIA